MLAWDAVKAPLVRFPTSLPRSALEPPPPLTAPLAVEPEMAQGETMKPAMPPTAESELLTVPAKDEFVMAPPRQLPATPPAFCPRPVPVTLPVTVTLVMAAGLCEYAL